MFSHIVIIFLFINSLQPYIFSKENEANELISQGRIQYQLLRERGSLPKYGSCWKSALETVDNGCRELSEETQSDIALALANCFLDMSGLETHHCEMDKKQNLRRICVSSMSDKAFNVYTEFYTHTLNMCWFLRGQIWQETISENTLKVGKQLETSAAKQEILLEIQRESLDIQSKMLQHSKDIESVLSDLSEAAQNNKEILLMLGQAVNDLQSWLIGEVSWINTLVFYVSSGIFFIIVTSTKQTIISRLPILTLLLINLCAERLLCSSILSRNDFKMNANQLFGNILDYVHVLRYCFLTISFCILFYKAYFYEDPVVKNKAILNDIFKQNQSILESLKVQKNLIPDRAYLVYKADSTQDHNVGSKKLIDTEDYRGSFKNIKYGDNSASPNPTRVGVTSSSMKYNLRKQRNTTPVLD